MVTRDRYVDTYYEILGLSEGATEEEIRRAYRRLALHYHPDRNPGDPEAEERFKAIGEAYAVLMDPDKRERYDAYRRASAGRATPADFGYSQDQVFRDLFSDPRLHTIFEELSRDFERIGLRFGEAFFRQVFLGRGVVFGGVFVWSPFGGLGRIFGRTREGTGEERSFGGGWRTVGERRRGGLLRPVARAVKGLFGQLFTGGRALAAGRAAFDLHYHLEIARDEADRGGERRVNYARGDIIEQVAVKIPAGVRPGTKLRLKGKGLHGKGGPGDLYLTVRIKS